MRRYFGAEPASTDLTPCHMRRLAPPKTLTDVAKSRRALHASALNLVARGSIVSSAMASTFESPDARKEEFRRYLERSGVIDALTKVLVGLYEEPEKPTRLKVKDPIHQMLIAATKLVHFQSFY